MALTNMKVFNTEIANAAIETLAQLVDKFNGASGGAIVLSTDGFSGDYLSESMWSSMHATQRRVDRYATNATKTSTAMAQIQHNSVKVAGGFGPLSFEPSQLSWMQKNPAEAIEVASRNLAESIMKDQLNTGIAAAVAAIGGQATATYAAAASAFTYTEMNSAHALFKDHSSMIVADVIDGTTYHDLVALNLANSATLFEASGVLVVDILGKTMVVTDAPALRLANPGKTSALGLVAGAIVVSDGSDLITNTSETNGKERIETTFQADYSFGLGLKGYAWDVTNGGKSPIDTEIATATNWDKVATDIKHTAGVVAQFVTPA